MLSSSASACITLASKVSGSICAMTCPFVTFELKSAWIFWMIPETWLPTSTSTTGVNWPLAVTVWVISPRLIDADLKSRGDSLGRLT